jgi:glutathione S-transferase
MEQVTKYQQGVMAFFFSHGTNPAKIKSFASSLPEMDQYLKNHTTPGKTYFLGAEHPTMPDLYIMPFWERIVMLENAPEPWATAYKQIAMAEKAPNIVNYVKAFKALPQFSDVSLNEKFYFTYLDQFKDFGDGKKPPFSHTQLQ